MERIKTTSTNYLNKQAIYEECNEMYAISLIGGQWTLGILSTLITGRMRFGEIRNTIPQITERMLTLELRKLEQNKIITRTVYAEVPPRVEYELTPIGYKLRSIIQELDSWGKDYKDNICNL
ncbi:helix-turn-helix domain-containing protein [Pedobacter aquatilis]|uniref:winged helix-turn-helix transcriptional regulator n=1 Tax=Pedobacter aquatilis TaxID=351343 RepID=UPI0029316822|nr:helix-turn-helix domain-containing protein [Pedobacter aquatilis]